MVLRDTCSWFGLALLIYKRVGGHFVYAAEFSLAIINSRSGELGRNRLTKVRESLMTFSMSSGRVRHAEGVLSEAEIFREILNSRSIPILGVFGGGADGVIRSTNCAMAPRYLSPTGELGRNRLTKVRESRMTSLMSSGRVELTEDERSEAEIFGRF